MVMKSRAQAGSKKVAAFCTLLGAMACEGTVQTQVRGAQSTALQLVSGHRSDLAGDQHDLLEFYRFRLSLWTGLWTRTDCAHRDERPLRCDQPVTIR